MTREYDASTREVPQIYLLEDYSCVASKIGSPPTLDQLEEHGAYTADDYQATFGSHSDIVEAAQDSRNQILVAIRRERSKRGHTPRLRDVRESEEGDISDISEHFGSWEGALEAAGVFPTADEIIEKIQEERENYDRVPNANEFIDRTEYRQVDYLYHFESWDDAVSTAGIGVEDEEFFHEIRRVTGEIGETPTLKEFEEAAPDAYATYQRNDRNWMETLEAAGVLPSRDDIIRSINRVVEDLGRLPSAGEFTNRARIRQAAYQHHFGNFMTALDAAGVLPSKEELLEEVHKVSKELESIPDHSEFYEYTKYSESVYDHHFESWRAVIAASGLIPSKEELGSQIRTVADETGAVPSRHEVIDRGDHKGKDYKLQFGSWKEALQTAGVLPSKDEFLTLVRDTAAGRGWIQQNELYETNALSTGYHTRFFNSWEDTLRAAKVSPSRGEFLELVRSVHEGSSWLDEQEFYRTSELPTGYHNQLFESWDEVLETAGVAPTKDEFLSMLRCTGPENGWIKQGNFYAESDLPSDYHTRFFDSWEDALRAAEVSPSRGEFLELVRSVHEASSWLDEREFYRTSELPTGYHNQLFESWDEVLETAGVAPTKDEFLSMLRCIEPENGWIKQGNFYAESDLPSDYHTRFFDSWDEALDAAGILPTSEDILQDLRALESELGDVPLRSEAIASGKYQANIYRHRFNSWKETLDAVGLLPSKEEQQLQELATDWGRPPSEEYARRHLAIEITTTEHDAPPITRNWNNVVEAAGLDPDDIDPAADLAKEIEQLAGTLEHRPNRTEVQEYLIEKSNYRANRWEINDAIQQAAIPDERDFTPTRSLTRQRDERNSGDIPSHTDLLAELNIIRSRTKSDKDSIESEFQSRGVIDERHYAIQFGSVSEAIDQLLTINTKRFSAPIERNFSLTPGFLRDSVKELGEILERPPLLEEAVSLGEANISDFVETFDSWGAVTGGESTATSWSNEELLDDVENVGRNLGKPPKHEELLEFGTVPVQCLLRRFGSWPRVLSLVGVDVDAIPQDYLGYEFTSEMWNTTDYIVRKEFGQGHALLDELHRLRFELDRVPSEKLIEQFSPYAPEKFTGAFGSITAAVERARITEPETAISPTTPSPEELLRELQSVSEAATTWVPPQDLSLHSEYSVGTYIGTFGSFESALEQAKLPTDHLVGPTETYGDAWHAEHQMKAGILRAIADLASRDEDNVTMARLQTVAGISQKVVYRFFDNWDEAREAARVRKSLGTVEVNPDDVENPDFVDNLLSEMDEMMKDY